MSQRSLAYPLRHRAMPPAESTRSPKPPGGLLGRLTSGMRVPPLPVRRKAASGIHHFEKHPACSRADSSPDWESLLQSLPQSISMLEPRQIASNRHGRCTRIVHFGCSVYPAFAELSPEFRRVIYRAAAHSGAAMPSVNRAASIERSALPLPLAKPIVRAIDEVAVKPLPRHSPAIVYASCLPLKRVVVRNKDAAFARR